MSNNIMKLPFSPLNHKFSFKNESEESIELPFTEDPIKNFIIVLQYCDKFKTYRYNKIYCAPGRRRSLVDICALLCSYGYIKTPEELAKFIITILQEFFVNNKMPSNLGCNYCPNIKRIVFQLNDWYASRRIFSSMFGLGFQKIPSLTMENFIIKDRKGKIIYCTEKEGLTEETLNEKIPLEVYEEEIPLEVYNGSVEEPEEEPTEESTEEPTEEPNEEIM